MRYALGGIFGFCFIFSVIYFIFGMSNFFSPRYAALDSEVFHQSAQYNDGIVREFQKLMLEYHSATTNEYRSSLKAVMQQQFGTYPLEKLPPHLRKFYEENLK